MGTGSSGIGGGGKLKKFSDKASDGWSYEGDGSETVNFFNQNSNYNKLIESMNETEQNAFRQWACGYFMSGQQYAGWDGMSETERKITAIYDKYLDQSTLKRGVELRRLATAELVLGAGHRTANIDDLKAMEGRIVTSKGSMSAGAAATGLTIGAGDKQVEYKFNIPGKTKGAGMWIGDGRINGWKAEQREFMINRDTSFRVGKSVYDAARNVYVVEMNYIGLGEHDYGGR